MTFWKRRNVVPCFITFYRKILLLNVLRNLYLFEFIKNLLLKLQASLVNCRGQCCDGESNMMGHKTRGLRRIKIGTEEPTYPVTAKDY